MGENSQSGHVPRPLRALPVPTTFGGVAALAEGRPGWLGSWQAAVALVAGLVVAWALSATWGRAIRHAAMALPDQAAIRDGRLFWPGTGVSILHQGPFVGIVVDPAGQRESALGSDVSLSIEGGQLGVRSLFGWTEVPYPADLALSLSRLEVTGNLAAWEGPALIGIALAVFLGLLAAWGILATIYGVVLWSLAGHFGRNVKLRTAWRLAAAALLLPALLMSGVIALYTLRDIGLTELLLAGPFHIVAGWIYCLGGFTRLPRPAANPFLEEGEPEAGPRAEPSANPFSRS